MSDQKTSLAEATAAAGHKRFKIAIWFEDDQAFELVPFVFFVSAANAAQQSFPFYFPDPLDSLTFETAVPRMESGQTIFAERNGAVPDYDVYVFITASHIQDNLFFVQDGKLVQITTFGWEEHFSPPSVFEYLFHSALCGAIYSLTGINHHRYSTMGCQFEYIRLKEYDRVDIALGYICQEHREQISVELGEKALDDSMLLFSFPG